MGQSTFTTVTPAASKYVFGSTSVTFPTNITGWTGRALGTSDAEPEVFGTATNGDSMVEQVGETTSANRMRKFQMEGYINSTFSEPAVPNTISFTKNNTTYFCFVRKVSDPYPKGSFVACTIDIESYALIQNA